MTVSGPIPFCWLGSQVLCLRPQEPKGPRPGTFLKNGMDAIQYDEIFCKDGCWVKLMACLIKDFRRIATCHGEFARNFVTAIFFAAALPLLRLIRSTSVKAFAAIKSGEYLRHPLGARLGASGGMQSIVD